MTQSKLTSMLQPQSRSAVDGGSTAPEVRRTLTLDEVEMDATETESCPPRPASGPFLTTECFFKALKENTAEIIGSFNASIGALSKRIDENSSAIANNAASIASHASENAAHKVALSAIEERVAKLEGGGLAAPSSLLPESRARLSHDYIVARRSAKLWPVTGANEEEIWAAVGDFLHDKMGISQTDVGQDDIEAISKAPGSEAQGVTEEVLVTFYEKKKRDLVMSSSPGLADCVNQDGKPNAGIRLEVPPELMDTFRLLTRFGARLRARHGPGTKRHIKFDDYVGSMFANIKLPGDTSWTRITPAMARRDLEASMREEASATQKRLAVKLVPGPRERLNKPMVVRVEQQGRPVPSLLGPKPTSAPVAGPSGKRPRWSAPDRGGHL